MVIEAAVAIGAGAAGASLTFLAFGLDSLIELLCGRIDLAAHVRASRKRFIFAAQRVQLYGS